ncbi:erythromycin esterase family protein [Pseudonocardia humida]|uniref:Erythromycin esterase family protein n=1 Tax=Pseudonocardia humida TaxID=2800819 RepID=A0ABT1ACH1_9PSEU|nr:erythromycin esterase family protein [Pseudonocardia humida]MCO1660656.1 erythromycin esterase family protein [Pseudonocardia humida]
MIPAGLAADAGTTVLATLDPAAPLDDLEPLVERLRGARVVAIGETAHFVREYALLRHRLLRLLVERCGFTAFGMESGFSEGLAVDAWTRGGPGDLADLGRDGITYRMGRCPEVRAQLAWMRAAGLPFAGLDVPGSNASPLPALRGVRRYLEVADPQALPLVDRLVAQVGRYADEHAPPAQRRYAGLSRADRDAMTAGLADLAVHLDALDDGSEAHDVARHELRLGCLLDLGMRGLMAMLTEGGPPTGVTARDRGMAETVFRMLERGGPGARVVVGAANSHIQRTPMPLPGVGEQSVLGSHLAARLGGAYVAIAVTAAAGTTTSRRADPDAPGGVAVVDVELGAPVAGSIEAVVPGGHLVDLRGARGPGPERIRVLDAYQPVPVLQAFDMVAVLDRISPVDRTEWAP